MTDTEQPTPPNPDPSPAGISPSAHLVRSRRRRRTPVFRRFIRGLQKLWRVEVAIGLIFVLGILLIASQKIRRPLWGLILGVVNAIGRALGGLLQRLASVVRGMSLANLFGYALVVLAIWLMAWLVRKRVMSNPRFVTRQCPRCGSGLHRIHRRTLDRVLDLYIPVRRYRCSSDACGWEGLRTGKMPES